MNASPHMAGIYDLYDEYLAALRAADAAQLVLSLASTGGFEMTDATGMRRDRLSPDEYARLLCAPVKSGCIAGIDVFAVHARDTSHTVVVVEGWVDDPRAGTRFTRSTLDIVELTQDGWQIERSVCQETLHHL